MLIFIFPSALHKTKDVLMNGKKGRVKNILAVN